jgi:peptide/nickel transport system permease protein
MKKAIVLVVTLILATYATTLIANFGGHIDNILRTQIEFEVSTELARNPQFHALPEEKQKELRGQLIESRIKAAGLDKPFFERSLIYLRQALTLDLGRAMFLTSASGSTRVSDIILERLPWSVLLFTTGTTLSAIIGVYLGLHMGRRALSKFDRSVTMFAITTSTIPPWFLGIIAILVFSFWLGIFPPGGIVSYPHESWTSWLLDFLHHLALPLIVWVFTYFGYWAYITRNLVIHILHEDYVMAARAKGLPEGTVMRRYVLRPAAPPVITMITLALIMSWMGAIITETVFSWPGLGMLYYEAIWSMDAPVIIGETVIYAYILIATVFALDIIYGILDPRIKVGRR